MTTDTRPTALVENSTAKDFATFAAVHLDVTDRERSLRFWRDLVGLELIGDAEDGIQLGAGGRSLVVLHPGATGPAPRARSGLYHLALHLPTLHGFARVVGRLHAAGVQHYPTDHLMHYADYIDDPDGNGLELAFETRDRLGSARMGPNGPELTDAEGRPHSGRAPIDLAWLFSHIPGGDVTPGLPAGTFMGHVHLRVADIDETVAYYRDVIGFTLNMYMIGLGAADMSAGGSFPHRLAANVWESAGRGQRPTGASGLRYVTLVLRSPGDLAATVARVEAAGGIARRHGDGVLVNDPSGNHLLLISTPDNG
ncbi:MAG TPA: VOC family protein [Thermomicrobiales bacterium]|nr:VOC family protein [Thermomicrobiales bacterium]